MIIFLWSIFYCIIDNYWEPSTQKRGIVKITSTRGDWSGLGYWKNCSYRVDYFSTPDSWNIGFEIVYRLIFYTGDTRLIYKFRQAFKKAFGLPDEHYEVEQVPEVGGSVYWRLYWDKKGFEFNLLQKCETRLNKVAESNDTKVVVLEMAIIPRSLEYTRKEVKANKRV